MPKGTRIAITSLKKNIKIIIFTLPYIRTLYKTTVVKQHGPGRWIDTWMSKTEKTTQKARNRNN